MNRDTYLIDTAASAIAAGLAALDGPGARRKKAKAAAKASKKAKAAAKAARKRNR